MRSSVPILAWLVLATWALLTSCGDGEGNSGRDAGPADAGVVDAGRDGAVPVTDAGPRDGGVTDAGPGDGGATDAGASDAGAGDGGVTDGGVTDAGASDGGATDGGATDAGATDGGATDGGAAPEPRLRIELMWQTLGDPDETDTNGSDLDLHFMHPHGVWNTLPWDCFSRNAAPDWGVAGDEMDDPALDADDRDGRGPENIDAEALEGTEGSPRTYSVGVYYVTDHGFGPSNATVRIFIDGEERFSRTFSGLESRQFWDVARIRWPSEEIELTHRLYPAGFP